MLRHSKTIHGKKDNDKDDEIGSDVETDNQSEEDSESKEQVVNGYDPWDSIIGKTFEKCQQQFEEEVQKLLPKMEVEDARAFVYDDMRPVYRKAAIGIFMKRMEWVNAIHQTPVYQAIKKTARELVDLDDYGREEAWKYATSKRKYLFDDILKEYNPPEIDEEEEDMDTDTETPPEKRPKV